MLEVRGLTVRYGDRVAVDGLDLTVAEGEICCLLGPSGGGKSTLLRAVAGLEAPATGTVTWSGRDLAGVPVHRRRFGLMFQEHALFPHRDVLGNVAFGLRMQGLPRAEIDARARAALARVGLAGFESRRVRDLSGGEQQRVALARAIAPEPRLLMLDEPLGSLDRALREQLVVELSELLRSLGVTTLFVTHDQDEAFALADHVVLLREGRIEQEGPPQEVWLRPATDAAARFLGFANLLPDERDGAPVWLATRPDGVRLSDPPAPPGGLVGRVARTTFRRDHFLVAVDTERGRLEVATAAPPPPGVTVVVTMDPDAVVVLPRPA